MSDYLSKSEIQLLGSRGYKLLKLITSGLDSSIYLARYNRPGALSRCLLACKVQDTQLMQPKYLFKFLPRELHATSALRHPHLVQVHSAIGSRGRLYTFTRWAERGDLFEHVYTRGCIPENEARLWARQIALALHYLHNLDIIHRDVKCENVLVTYNYNCKLADFGFVRQVTAKSLCNTYCGSLNYTAPEILHGAPYEGKPTDVWSLGVVFYVMLNRAFPFPESSLTTLRENQLAQRWKFRDRVARVISKEAKQLVELLLIPDPLDRPTIQDVISSSWFAEGGFQMTPEEQRALEYVPSTKSSLGNYEDIRKLLKEVCSSKNKEFIEFKEVQDIYLSEPDYIYQVENEDTRVVKKRRKCCIC